MSSGQSGGRSRNLWLVRLAIVTVVAVLVAALEMWSGRWVLLLPAMMMVYAAFAVSRAAVSGAAAIRAFGSEYPGKDLLLVFSDSPRWKDHIVSEWLPRWGERAVVVNLSEIVTPAAQPAAIALFRSVVGKREHNPIAIVVPPAGRIRVIRFWRAFRESAQGDDRALRDAEARLDLALGTRSHG